MTYQIRYISENCDKSFFKILVNLQSMPKKSNNSDQIEFQLSVGKFFFHPKPVKPHSITIDGELTVQVNGIEVKNLEIRQRCKCIIYFIRELNVYKNYTKMFSSLIIPHISICSIIIIYTFDQLTVFFCWTRLNRKFSEFGQSKPKWGFLILILVY